MTDITFFGSGVTPADGPNTNSTATTITVVPPANMLNGQLCVMYAMSGFGGSIATLSMVAGDGQTWNAGNNNINSPGAGFSGPNMRMFWCEFTGTWLQNPKITCGDAFAGALSGLLLVYNKSSRGTHWNIANGTVEVSSVYAVVNNFSVTNPSQSPTDPSTVTVAFWNTSGVPTFNLQTTGSSSSGATPWLQPNPQYRNNGATSQPATMSIAYSISNTVPTAGLGSVINQIGIAGANAGVAQWGFATKGAGTPLKITLPNPVGAGNTILTILSEVDLGLNSSWAANVFDNVSTASAYVLDAHTNTNDKTLSIWRRSNVNAATSYGITANANTGAAPANVNWAGLVIDAYNIAYGAPAVGDIITATARSTGPISVTSNVLSRPYELLFSALMTGGLDITANNNPASPWVVMQSSNTFPSLIAAYQNVTRNTAVTASFGSLPASDQWGAAIVGYPYQFIESGWRDIATWTDGGGGGGLIISTNTANVAVDSIDVNNTQINVNVILLSQNSTIIEIDPNFQDTIVANTSANVNGTLINTSFSVPILSNISFSMNNAANTVTITSNSFNITIDTMNSTVIPLP